MNRARPLQYAATSIFVFASLVSADAAEAPAKKSFEAPHAQSISIEMIGPVTQTTDLQILCILKHDPAGDKYLEAMDDFNQKLNGLLSQVRGRDEFVGEFGETLLFTPPANSIAPKRVLLIGVGDEAGLTLEKLKIVGGIAAREALRLKASHVSFAPTLRDQGSSRLDVGEGDASVAAGWVLAYDTEKKLQAKGLSPSADVTEFVFEAGPKYFDGAVTKVAQAVKETGTAVGNRSAW